MPVFQQSLSRCRSDMLLIPVPWQQHLMVMATVAIQVVALTVTMADI
jgi:hypothetical protein